MPPNYVSVCPPTFWHLPTPLLGDRRIKILSIVKYIMRTQARLVFEHLSMERYIIIGSVPQLSRSSQ